MAGEAEQQLRAYVEYLRDLGVHDFYRRGESVIVEPVVEENSASEAVAPVPPAPIAVTMIDSDESPAAPRPAFLEPPIAKLVSFDNLAPLPEIHIVPARKADALIAIKEEIGDCTRCPLAYAGRRTIVFGEGDPNARLMFVGEGPGADEDASGRPFVGKAGQLLNNMIQAMGLQREQVYIANIVKCRPPNNRTPEPVEANTCDQFLLQQIDVIQPEVVVALGSTAATYLLGLKQSLSALRGRWHRCRGAKLAVTYHPAFLLRDPRMKAEAWKDLQMVMKQMGLKPPAKASANPAE
ncbi:MAG TPA: uracil-DNA glycosylase [Edaphobacter sp.]|jgi:uracil-DNA glycosylase family 4|nr:uracil-DNA glycosylase [Edaphobacter sp.]